MRFELKSVLSEMKDLYSKPISNDRFKKYISKLQGYTKNNLALPISGYNPMAKGQILTKISELKVLDAELIMQEVIDEFNFITDTRNECSIKPSK